MNYIQTNAELAVREMLKEFGKKLGKTKLCGSDFMDDGTVIKLCVDINSEDGSATFDFT